MRNHSRVPHLLGLFAMLMGALALPTATTAQMPTCADYSSTAAAQFALDINPNLASSLDPDGNGIACDDAAGAAQTPSSTELQLPTDQAQPTTGQQQPTADVIDGQPTQPSTQQQQTQPQGGDLDGRIGGTRASIEAVYGQPVQETPSENDPAVTGVAYAGSGSIAGIFVVYHSDQAIIIWLTPAQPWTTAEASGVLSGFVPSDITTLPNPETLSDGSLLMTVNSPILAGAASQQAMTAAKIPGAPGDMYLLLTTDGGQMIVDVEIGVGNGENVREDVNGGQAGQTTTGTTTTQTTTTSQPTPPPVTGTTTDSAAFLQQARTEVDQYQAEIAELRTILAKDTFTDADTTRLSEIVVGWMAIDTTPITAPPEHAALADQLTSVHADLSNAGGIVFMVISTGDTSRVQEAADAINRADQTLITLDQQLTALGV